MVPQTETKAGAGFKDSRFTGDDTFSDSVVTTKIQNNQNGSVDISVEQTTSDGVFHLTFTFNFNFDDFNFDD